MAAILPQPTPEQPKQPKPEPAASEGKPPPVIDQKDIVRVIISEMQRGSLAAATKKYINCVNDCYEKWGGGKEEDRPYLREREVGSRMRITDRHKRKRFIQWRIENRKLKICLSRCKGTWFKAVIKLIGEAKFQRLNEDVLGHILTMLVTDLRKKGAVKILTGNPTLPAGWQGGRKTRRKKGTTRRKKSRKRRKRRKSKRKTRRK